jgi:hypothetical protein
MVSTALTTYKDLTAFDGWLTDLTTLKGEANYESDPKLEGFFLQLLQ